MFNKFLAISPEKQARIVNAALKQFALKGYQLASTNEIVKEADISKGMLFHYFHNKKGLYLYLYDHAIETIMEQILARINWDEKDIFLRYREVGRLKFDLFVQYPDLFNFLQALFKEDASEVKEDIDHRNREVLTEGLAKLFADVDVSKFKQGIDPDKAMDMIHWTMEGFAYQQQTKAMAMSLDEMNIETIFAEMDVYIELLRKAFYS